MARGAPALLYRASVGPRGTVAAGLLQATSLPFIVASTSIGVSLDLITPATAAAFVAAGLGSALIFPVVALGALKGRVHAGRASGSDRGHLGAGRALGRLSAVDQGRRRALALSLLVLLLVVVATLIVWRWRTSTTGSRDDGTAAPDTTIEPPTGPLAPLTGLVDPSGETAHRSAVTVKVGNTADSEPHDGIEQADVV